MRLKNISEEESRLFAYLLFNAFYAHKKDSIFICIKKSKEKKVACLTFCAFVLFVLFGFVSTSKTSE